MSHRWTAVAVSALVSVLILGGAGALLSESAAQPQSTALGHEGAGVGLVFANEPTVSRGVPREVLAPSSGSLRAPAASVRAGAESAPGSLLPCTVTVGGQASCATPGPVTDTSPATSYSHSPEEAPPAATPTWYNVTSNLSKASGGVTPVVGFGGRMAYDPLLDEVVLFDSCPSVPCELSNQTWTYNGVTWTDLTGTLPTAPSAREGAGLAYDPSFKGVILFGGANSAGTNLNDTWLFNGTGWHNITAAVGLPTTVVESSVNWAWGAMAWDPGLDTMVVVDGCVDDGCTDVWGQTWFLNVTGWSAAWGPSTLANGTYLAYNSLAYDAADGYLVAYGGYDAYSMTSQNYTYTMNGSGTWVNITDTDAGCVAGTCYTPPGRDSEAMTWDSQLNAVFMTAGFNDTTTTWLNDSWTFSGGAWYPADLKAAPAPAGYCPRAQPSLSGMSDNIAPFITGGYGPDCPGTEEATSEWVYEVSPQPALSASPIHIDLGTASDLTASWTVGTGSGIVATFNISFGDGQFHLVPRGAVGNTSTPFSTSASHTYAASGTFATMVRWVDFFYVYGQAAGPTITVNPALVAAITASAKNVTAGGSITFSTSPTGGSGTYTYAWSFGDGTTSAVQDPAAHTYAKAGTYVVNLTVTDSLGQSVKATSVTITVSAPPSSGFSLSGTDAIYLVVGLVLVVLVIVVVVLLTRRKKPTTAAQPWQTGTPPAGTGAPPPGAGGNVPPGAGGSPPPPPPS